MTRPMVLVHVLGSFQIGGAEQVVVNLTLQQARAGHEVHVVSLTKDDHGPHEQSFLDAGVAVHRMPKLGPTVDPTLVVRLARLFAHVGADLAHSHNPQPIIYAAPAAKLAGIPLVHTKHGANQSAARSARLRRMTSRLATCVVGVSNETLKDAERQREIGPGQGLVIENGIDVDAYKPDAALRTKLREELGLSRECEIIGNVGRLNEIKNQTLLVSAAAPLLNERRYLVIVGEGPARPTIEAAIRQSGKASFIRLMGQRLDVCRLLPAFDIFVLSSDSEGLPMVIPEAMASGVPVISTAVGGIPDVIEDGVTGLLVAPRNPEALRGRIESLLDSPETRTSMIRRGRELAERKYSLATMAERYMDLYRTLVSV